MFRFCGYGLELFVDEVLTRRQEDPSVCTATDATGQRWLIVASSVDPANLAWVCAPASPHTLDLVRSGHSSAYEAVSHSPTGWVEMVSIVDGHSVPDRRIACSDLPAALRSPFRLAS